jgi:hypothetical protein
MLPLVQKIVLGTFTWFGRANPDVGIAGTSIIAWAGCDSPASLEK